MRSWNFFIAFCLVGSCIYFPLINGKKGDVAALYQRLEMAITQKKAAIEKQEDLKLRLASQNDPAWIEMVLMRDLGVVPEGFLKVHFQK